MLHGELMAFPRRAGRRYKRAPRARAGPAPRPYPAAAPPNGMSHSPTCSLTFELFEEPVQSTLSRA